MLWRIIFAILHLNFASSIGFVIPFDHCAFEFCNFYYLASATLSSSQPRTLNLIWHSITDLDRREEKIDLIQCDLQELIWSEGFVEALNANFKSTEINLIIEFVHLFFIVYDIHHFNKIEMNKNWGFNCNRI